MSDDITRGLPADLVSVLRNQSIVVSQDTPVFEMLAAWAHAPSMTASADIVSPADPSLIDLDPVVPLASSTTPAGCYQ